MQSERSKAIEEKIYRHVDEDKASDLDRVETRECSSERFKGVQVNVYGRIVPVRPVINLVAETEGIAIESLYHTVDAPEPHLGVFIAYLPEQPHPAFV